MNKIFYLLVINVIAVLGLLFYLNVQVYFKVKSNETQMGFSQKVVQEVQQSKIVLEETLIKHKGEITFKEKMIDKEKEKSIELSRKLSEKVNETLILKDALRKKKTIEEMFNEDRIKFKKEKKTLQAEVDQLKKDNKGLKERIEQLKKAPVLTGLSSPTQLSGVGASMGASASKKTLKIEKPKRDAGFVLSKNPDYNFVVVALGSEDGIFMGQRLNVLREGQIIGKVRVEKIFDKMSSAVILQDTFRDKKIAQGDNVRVFR